MSSVCPSAEGAEGLSLAPVLLRWEEVGGRESGADAEFGLTFRELVAIAPALAERGR